MDVAIFVSIGTIVTSSFVAITVVKMSAGFALRQAHLGKVWDRKAEAYSEILEALHEIADWFQVAMDDELLQREVAADVQALRQLDYQKARQTLRRRIAREVWLLPDVAQQRVVSMNIEMSKRRDSWFDHLDFGSFEARETIKDIAGLAKTDLNQPSD